MKAIHLVGIGGVGMSALAEALLDTGARVSGSERFLDQGRPLPVLDTLRHQGAAIVPQDGRGVRSGLDAVVVSSAIEADNPDVRAAHRLGVPVTHRADMLAQCVAGRRLIAVTGTCGKSTITGMLGHILDVAGQAPTVINGAACVNWASTRRTGAVLRGTGPFCVIEADESDKSLLAFHPECALVANASADHFPIAETHALFDAFLAQVSGFRLDGRQPPACVPAIEESDWSCSFPFRGTIVTLPLPGRHNAVNAWQAATLADALGIPASTITTALATFKGIKRRMETIGRRADGARVVDEYAHNTEKIRAALLTLQPRSSRVLALWRPHGYGPLEKMFDSLVTVFTETLRPADRLFLLPVFDAGGSASRAIDSRQLHKRLLENGVAAEWLPDHDAAVARMGGLAEPGDILLTMGARDPDLPETARRLVMTGRHRNGR